MDYIQMFKAMSDNTRIRILNLLFKSKIELCICEIMDSLKLAQYNISKHIRELKIAGLVKERKDGRFVFYSVVEPKNAFHRNILQALKAIPKNKEDIYLLKKNIALRKNGKIVVGCITNRKKCR